MKIALPGGATSQTVNIFVQDSSATTGVGLSGLAFNSGSLIAYYVRPGAAAVAITLATLAAVTSAFSSGGFKEIDATNMKGVYRLDIPNAALASGVSSVVIMLSGATNMAPVLLEIQLNLISNIWDEVNTGSSHNVNNSTGKQLRTIAPTTSDVIRTATAAAGGASTMTLDSGASAVNNAYQYDILSIISGTGAGQSKWIASYVGSTKVATVNSAWTTPPDNTSVFEITPTSVAQVLGAVLVDMTQAVPTSNTAETHGDCLIAARTQAFGKWALVGTTLSLYANDGTTVMRSFTLDSATAPTSRT